MGSHAPTTPSPAPGRLPVPGWAGVAALILLHVALALWAVSGKSVTADEILHVTGGYFYNKFNDYRIQPENGVMPQRVAALPAVLMGAPPPPLADNIYWRTSDASVIGHQLFYETGHDHWPMLMAGRALMTVFSAGTALLVFCWSRRLFGATAGFFALTLYALCPNILAHAPLATSDLPAVFFLLATLGAFWRFLDQPSWSRGALSAVALGLACVAKYSAVLLPPMMLLLLGWRVWRDAPAARTRWLRLAPLAIAGHAVVSIAIIWAFYGFRFQGFAAGVPPADHYIAPWDVVLPYIGFHRPLVEFCLEWRVLPEAFLYGYAWVVQSANARSAFLAGDYSLLGWVSFFPLAFLWKTPVSVLAALATGLVVAARRWRAVRLDAVAPLLVLFATYWAFSLTSHLNIGHRHILPTYPVIFILLGGLAAPGVLPGLWRRLLPAGFALGLLAANLRAAPHYLAFFNTFAGGPANGHRLLVDSSLDWGQDLPALTRWLRENNAGPAAQPVFLSYFGSGEPDYYQIKATRLPFVNGFKLRRPWYAPAPGIYCVSATMLQQVYSPGRGGWSVEKEKQYQEGRAKDHLFRNYWNDPSVRAELAQLGAAEDFERTWVNYDTIRFARLCHYLRARQPDAQPGYSILVYRLDQAEIDAALNGDLRQLGTAIEQALGAPKR
jgi:4-amino-4-deoxy-L-arabinose transferase-like glycosyltransferase